MNWIKWLTPGLRVKRWLLLFCVGAVIATLGVVVAFDIPGVYLHFVVADHLYQVMKQHVTPAVGGSVIACLGLVLMVLGFREIVKSIAAAIAPGGSKSIIEVVYRKHRLEQGPRVVALGGGTGLPALLRGLKDYTNNITAVVAVSDDGGSSGRLRELGFPPPGDIRNCLVALSDVEAMMQKLFQYRFHHMGEALDGHSFGNLLIAALTDITGDFDRAVKESSKVLAIRGQVLPATLENVVLCAELENDQVVKGQVQVSLAPARIRRAFLEPEHPRALTEVLQAIAEADAIVIGPGSLYSSVIPNLLVGEIRDAIRQTTAPKIYVCNVMTQPNETLGLTKASDHVRVLINHAGSGILDYAVLNSQQPSPRSLSRYQEEGAEFVQPDREEVQRLGVRPILYDLLSEDELVRHDPSKLANVIYRIYEGDRHLPRRKRMSRARMEHVAR